jgi:hypothetical protein
MKKSMVFGILLIILCFVVVFSFASKKVQKRNEEIDAIHRAVESAIGGYLKEQRLSKVLYNTLPIYYDRNRCIIVCRVEIANESGAKHWLEFDNLLRYENKTWKAKVVGVYKYKPVPVQDKMTVPWKKSHKPAQKGRSI